MKQNYILAIITILILTPLNSKEVDLKIAPNLRLTKDSLVNNQILESLDLFLSSINKDYKNIPNIRDSERIETYILLDEIVNLNYKVNQNDTLHFDPIITKILSMVDSSYLVEISYLGIDEETPIYRATIELLLEYSKDNLSISSPLLMKTKNWKSVDNINGTVNYDFNIEETDAFELLDYITKFDNILGINDIKSTYYYTTNSSELLDIIGVKFKSDYNGISTGSLNYNLDNENLVVLGNKDYDPHDLWHSRLSLLKSRKDCFKFIDEGCAYLYGGSWGFSWDEILNEFKNLVVKNGNNNWLSIKSSPSYFETGGFKNSVDYIITALLISEVEKKHGYDGLRELIRLNPDNNSIDEYYSILNRLINVNESNYNVRVNEILKNH